VFAQSACIMSVYRNAPEIDSVVKIELPISEMLFQAATPDGKPLYDIEGQPVATPKRRGDLPLWEDEKGEYKLIDITHKFFMPTLDENNKIIKDKDGKPVWSKTALFHGYVDMVARDSEGRLIIIDHKSSMEAPTPAKVARHEQLNAYCFAVYHLTGERPFLIGINHLRTGKLITAPFDLE